MPSLRQVAEVLHQGTAGWPGSLVVTVTPTPADVAIGTWPVPDHVVHPADPLVGFLAPEAWTAIGLVTRGRTWSTDPADTAGEAVRITSLFGRDGSATSLLTRGHQPAELIDETPAGWVADVLARALALSTPAPETTLSTWVEAAWLDRIAEIVLDSPGRVRRWDALARLHPLADPGVALPGVLLAVETRALDLESSWTRMRCLWRGVPPVAPDQAPPGGRPVELPHWFDDGSFSRWVARNLVPGEDLLPGVLDALPQAVADELVEALVATVAPVGQRG
jgi:hypothetical protein